MKGFPRSGEFGTSAPGRAAISRQHVNTYRRTLAEQHRVTGNLNEGVVSKAFADLLERTGKPHGLIFSPQREGRGPRGNLIRVDGALIPSILRVPFGYWEAKDEKDDLDREIAAKLARGYPDERSKDTARRLDVRRKPRGTDG